ncbi:hypothetical protein [uncultured Pseudoteredinibacter sp.]|uniref:hypothetical protein n=1 Tax=uncultured Pseudoteredinibacter sp. TaxID=1641701 RepID=UPI00261CC08F|nr:hypothetical protein [uncultured Pseudoteredinibacter sp.]
MKYIPNKISLAERLWNIALSALLLIYGGYGIYINDLYLPARTGSGLSLHDGPAILMFGAFACGALVMLSVVVDHYDERDNEYKYQVFARVFKYLAWSLFAAALIYNLLN